MERIPTDWLPHYTLQDYQHWEGDWELIRGVPFAMSPGPLRKHQLAGSRFVYLASAALRDQPCSDQCEVLYKMDWIVDEATVVRPDVMILCGAGQSDYVRIPPVLVLEIFSPATRLKDRNLKFSLYQSNGVKYYLMADPERQHIEVFCLHNNRFEEYGASLFYIGPDCKITIDLSQIWQ